MAQACVDCTMRGTVGKKERIIGVVKGHTNLYHTNFNWLKKKQLHTGLLGPMMRRAMPLSSRFASSPSFFAGIPLKVPIQSTMKLKDLHLTICI